MTGRKETGNRQTSDPYQNFCLEGRAGSGGKAQKPDPGKPLQRKP